MSADVRVRFAPWSYGTFTYRWCAPPCSIPFLLKHNGTRSSCVWLQTRIVFVEAQESCIIGLNWCNIPFDEGPGKMSDHGPYHEVCKDRYKREYALQLIENGCLLCL
jgi:glutamyl-tRNA synthetase